jgi:hypothetical protein
MAVRMIIIEYGLFFLLCSNTLHAQTTFSLSPEIGYISRQFFQPPYYVYSDKQLASNMKLGVVADLRGKKGSCYAELFYATSNTRFNFYKYPVETTPIEDNIKNGTRFGRGYYVGLSLGAGIPVYKSKALKTSLRLGYTTIISQGPVFAYNLERSSGKRIIDSTGTMEYSFFNQYQRGAINLDADLHWQHKNWVLFIIPRWSYKIPVGETPVNKGGKIGSYSYEEGNIFQLSVCVGVGKIIGKKP